jgi:uncharacterized membrane protein
MLLWIAIAGALVGWVVDDLDGFGFVAGGVIGLIVGGGIRRSIRAEVRKALGAVRAEIDVVRLLATTPPREESVPPSTVEPTPVPAPAPRPTTARVVMTGPDSHRTPPTIAPAAPSAPPAEPGIIDQAFAAARNWIFGGNTIVRAGLAVLFVGLSFLASWAAAAGLFPIELRLTLVAGAGIALLVVGYRTRMKRSGFGLTLQGGGIATIYLTLFAAARLFDTVPVTMAFALMIVVCALACVLALLQGSQALAVTAFAGGFAVPMLLGSANPPAKASAQTTILNLAILGIATKRAWRGLNLLGFAATFGQGGLWGAVAYLPANFALAQSFLVANILIYVAMAVLYTRATPGKLGHVVDTTLLFGPALAGFGLQAALVHDRPFATAFAALGFAALYIGVAFATSRYRRESYRVMNEAMLAIGIGFVTLAVPLALGAGWTSAAWALEGAGAFWVGMRQARWMPRLFGLGLQAVAALLFVAQIAPVVSAWPLLHAGFVGAVLIAGALLATGWWLRGGALPHSGSALAGRYAALEELLGKPVFLIGFGFWCGAWMLEAVRAVPAGVIGASAIPVSAPATQVLLAMLAFLLSALVAQRAAGRLRWEVAAWPSLVSLPVLAIGFVWAVGYAHLPTWPGWAIWIVAITVHLRMLHRNDVAPVAGSRVPVRIAHVGGVWLATLMIADILWFAVDQAGLWGTSWAGLVFLASAVGMLVALTLASGPALRDPATTGRWPVNGHAVDYGWMAGAGIAAIVFIGAVLTALFAEGRVAPLPYVPLLNPVDLTLALSIAALVLWRRTMLAAGPAPRGVPVLRGTGALAALGGLAFLVVNAAWLRAAHHLLGIDWSSDALMGSEVVQTGLAILWTLIALGLMVIAQRRAERTPWLAGAALLGLTVLKLLLVDLDAAGGGARIITFIAVGVMMLVVGYAAPLPPKPLRSGEPA